MTRPLRFALLGDPVSGSRSPAIQREALRLAGLKGDYSAIKADEAILGATVAKLMAGEYDGLNVTMPLKASAAKLAGGNTSINTLRCRDSAIEGISTDTLTFVDILAVEGFADIDSVLVLGTGGSAVAAMAAIGERHVYLSGRNEQRVAALVGTHEEAVAVPWGVPVADALIINCTPLGMRAERLPEAIVESSSALIDLPYGLRTTPATALATDSGIPHVDGYEFLARQAAASFEWWTGIAVDFNQLTEIARNV